MERKASEMLTPVSPAFVGDAVHTLYIRRRLVESGVSVGTMHLVCSRYVNARCQAAVYDELVRRGEFTDEESEIARRAKNAHLHSRAKTASSAEYHKATALEAVIGFLELTDNDARKNRILSLCGELSGLDKFLAEAEEQNKPKQQ